MTEQPLTVFSAGPKALEPVWTLRTGLKFVVPVGDLGVPQFVRKPGKHFVLELVDEKASRWTRTNEELSSLAEFLFPHPRKFRLLWQLEQALFVWEPVPEDVA